MRDCRTSSLKQFCTFPTVKETFKVYRRSACVAMQQKLSVDKKHFGRKFNFLVVLYVFDVKFKQSKFGETLGCSTRLCSTIQN
jgi:hypothetical protein